MPKLPDKSKQQIIPVESIQQRIYLIRGHKVMLDRDLFVRREAHSHAPAGQKEQISGRLYVPA